MEENSYVCSTTCRSNGDCMLTACSQRTATYRNGMRHTQTMCINTRATNRNTFNWMTIHTHGMLQWCWCDCSGVAWWLCTTVVFVKLEFEENAFFSENSLWNQCIFYNFIKYFENRLLKHNFMASFLVWSFATLNLDNGSKFKLVKTCTRNINSNRHLNAIHWQCYFWH